MNLFARSPAFIGGVCLFAGLLGWQYSHSEPRQNSSHHFHHCKHHPTKSGKASRLTDHLLTFSDTCTFDIELTRLRHPLEGIKAEAISCMCPFSITK